MTELHLAPIEESESTADVAPKTERGKFEKAWRLAHRSQLHRSSMRGILKVRTIEELAAMEAAEEEERRAAAEHDADLHARVGYSSITSFAYTDMADQFGHFDPSHPRPKQSQIWE